MSVEKSDLGYKQDMFVCLYVSMDAFPEEGEWASLHQELVLMVKPPPGLIPETEQTYSYILGQFNPKTTWQFTTNEWTQECWNWV